MPAFKHHADKPLGGFVRYCILGFIADSSAKFKVPQHFMKLSDFHILWFVLGIAVMLGLEALKKHTQKVPVH